MKAYRPFQLTSQYETGKVPELSGLDRGIVPLLISDLQSVYFGDKQMKIDQKSSSVRFTVGNTHYDSKLSESAAAPANARSEYYLIGTIGENPVEIKLQNHERNDNLFAERGMGGHISLEADGQKTVDEYVNIIERRISHWAKSWGIVDEQTAMKVRKPFFLRDIYSSVSGIAPDREWPPRRTLERGDVPKLVEMLGTAGLKISSATVKYKSGNDEHEAALPDYLKMDDKGYLRSYFLKGKSDDGKNVEIALRPSHIRVPPYSRGLIIAPGSLPADFFLGIEGDILVEKTGDASVEDKYFEPFLKEISDWSSTCRLKETEV